MCDNKDKALPANNKTKYAKRLPKLNVVNGTVTINPNDPLQKKWFEDFKK